MEQPKRIGEIDKKYQIYKFSCMVLVIILCSALLLTIEFDAAGVSRRQTQNVTEFPKMSE